MRGAEPAEGLGLGHVGDTGERGAPGERGAHGELRENEAHAFRAVRPALTFSEVAMLTPIYMVEAP